MCYQCDRLILHLEATDIFEKNDIRW